MIGWDRHNRWGETNTMWGLSLVESNLQQKRIKTSKTYLAGGWVVSCRKYYHFVAPSCKLELARFSAWLRIQDGAECGKKLGAELGQAHD